MNKKLKAFLTATAFLTGCANATSFMFGIAAGMDRSASCERGVVPLSALLVLPGYLSGCVVETKLEQPVKLPWKD